MGTGRNGARASTRGSTARSPPGGWCWVDPRSRAGILALRATWRSYRSGPKSASQRNGPNPQAHEARVTAAGGGIFVSESPGRLPGLLAAATAGRSARPHDKRTAQTPATIRRAADGQGDTPASPRHHFASGPGLPSPPGTSPTQGSCTAPRRHRRTAPQPGCAADGIARTRS